MKSQLKYYNCNGLVKQKYEKKYFDNYYNYKKYNSAIGK